MIIVRIVKHSYTYVDMLHFDVVFDVLFAYLGKNRVHLQFPFVQILSFCRIIFHKIILFKKPPLNSK